VQVLPAIQVRFEERIYEAHAQNLLKLIRKQANEIASLMLVGHNPGLTDLVNYFATDYIDNVPTTGLLQFEFSITNWQQLNAQTANLVYFEYPKLYFPKEATQ
jgi:phosphohistidine phosphatase